MPSELGDINAYLAEQNYNLGVEYLKIGDYLKAYQSLQACLKANINNADAWIKLGIACQKLGRYNEAITANNNAQGVISGNPLTAFIYEEVIQLSHQSEKCYQNRDLECAIALCEQAIQIQPSYAAIWYQKGVVLCGLERYEEAIAAYETALEIDPKFHGAWHELGNALAGLKQILSPNKA